MNIRNNTIQNNSTSFKGLYASKRTLKEIGYSKKSLLKNSRIKEAAEKYDVLIKSSPRDKTEYVNVLKWMFTRVGSSMAVGAAGVIGFGSNHLGYALLSGIIPAFAVVAAWCGYDSIRSPKHKILVQAGKGIDERYYDGHIKGCATLQYELNDIEDFSLPNLIEEVQEREVEEFIRKIKSYNTNDLFTPKKYLSALKSANIPNLGGGKFFNRAIDKQGNTMITTFFDILPDETSKEYNEILDIIKNTEGIDYNLKDGNGITCLEKIIFSENKSALPLIDGKTFLYSPELELVYNNIQDESFKNEFDKLDLKFDFPDIMNAVRTNSFYLLRNLRPQLLSKFCDRVRLASQIEDLLREKTKNPQNDSDRIASGYLHTCHYSEFLNPSLNFRLTENNDIIDW